MVKNNMLNRRLFFFVGVIILFFCLIVPVSAADVGTVTTQVYSYIPWSSVTIEGSSGNATLPFPLQSVFSGDSSVSPSRMQAGSYFIDLSAGSYVSGMVSGSMTFSSALAGSSVYFYCPSVVISNSSLNSYSNTFSFGSESQGSGTVSLTGTLWYMESQNDTYVPKSTVVFYSTSFSGSVNVMQLLKGQIDSEYLSSGYAYLTDLRVQFSGFSNSGSVISYASNVASNLPTVSQWVNGYGLSSGDTIVYEPADPGDLDFSWLVGSVSDTLEIELWPGFSIGGVLRIIFITGFLFWFLKLTF